MFMEQKLDKRSLLICHHSAQFAVPTQHPILARNDLYCGEWGVKLYSNSNSVTAELYAEILNELAFDRLYAGICFRCHSNDR